MDNLLLIPSRMALLDTSLGLEPCGCSLHHVRRTHHSMTDLPDPKHRKHSVRGDGSAVLHKCTGGTDRGAHSFCSVDNCGQFIRQAEWGELHTLYSLAQRRQELLCECCCRRCWHRR